MTEAPTSPALLWHPLTPKGVAGAAAAPRWQVWIAMGLTAALAVFSLLNFLNQCWRPVIVEAIEHLEDGGLIRNGVLQPGGAKTDATLARNRHLSIGLNWTDTSLRDQASDVRVFLQCDVDVAMERVVQRHMAAWKVCLRSQRLFFSVVQ